MYECRLHPVTSLSIATYAGAVGVTDMNDHSSRSHTIFTVTVERCELGADKKHHVRMGKLHLVDLAVSACTHTGGEVHIHMRALTHTHTHTHTHTTHTHTHTHTQGMQF